MNRAARRVLSILGVFIIVFVAGMGSEFYKDYVRPLVTTLTPSPTASKLATNPLSIARTEFAQTKEPCYSSSEITEDMAGTWMCMYGHITDLDETNGTVIYFDNFFTLRSKYNFDGLKKYTCAWAEGQVLYDDRGPYIQIETLRITPRCTP